MKKIILFLFSCVLLATACTQNTTTPTVPPATNTCGYSTNSNVFIELKINGNTFRCESLIYNGVPFFGLGCGFITELGRRKLWILPVGMLACPLNSTNYLNNLSIGLEAEKSSNFQDPIGIYNKSGDCQGSFSYYSTITGTTKGFIIPTDSLTVTVTSCTADFVSGTFVGTALETNTNIPYPISGSFNNLVRSGF